MSFKFHQKKIIEVLIILIIASVGIFGNVRQVKAFVSPEYDTEADCNAARKGELPNWPPPQKTCFECQKNETTGKFFFRCGEKTGATGTDANSAVNDGDIIERTISYVFGWVAYLIFWVFARLFTFVGGLFDGVLMLDDFSKYPAVMTGWTATRDLVNIFFALALLIIAFATILRLETYGVKKALPWLIIIALLINFSWTISGAIIDFSQVTMKAFLSTGLPGEKIGDSISAAIVGNNSAIGGFFKSGWGWHNANFEMIVQMIFLIILLGGLIVAFGVVAGMLVVRIIALWILLILAPLAWFCLILPGTKKMWNAWWSSFLKYVIYGPAAVFFIWLTVMIANPGNISLQIASDKEALKKIGGVSGWLAMQFLPLVNYIFILILMFGTFIVARYLGVAGAATSIGVAKWFGKGAWGGANRWMARGGRVPILGRGLELAGRKISGWGGGLKDRGWRRMGGFIQGTAGVGRTAFELKRTAVGGLSPTNLAKWWTIRKQVAESQSYSEGVGRLENVRRGIQNFSRPIDFGRSLRDAYRSQISTGARREVDIFTLTSDPTITQEQRNAATPLAGGIQSIVTTADLAALTPEERRTVNPRAGGPTTRVTFGTPSWNALAPEQKAFAANIGGTNEYEVPQEFLAPQEFEIPETKTAGAGGAWGQFLTAMRGMDAEMARQHEVEKRRDYFDKAIKDEDTLVSKSMSATDPYDKEALYMIMAMRNGFNTFFARLGQAFDPQIFKRHLNRTFGDIRGSIIGANLSALGLAAGNSSLGGTTTYDPNLGRIRFSTDTEQQRIISTKMREGDPQLWSIKTHPDSFFERDRSGRLTTNIHMGGMSILQNITPGNIRWIERMQARTVEALYNARVQIQELANRMAPGKQRDLLQEFLNKTIDRYARLT